MNAAELASFRARLQAQAPPPPRPDRALFARMRARLTVVARTDPPTDAPTRPRPACPARLEVVTWSDVKPPGLGDPPSARRRLQRLAGVLDAERRGLDARLAAEAATD